MNASFHRATVNACLLSALALAVSSVLPLTEDTIYLDADGRPAGLLSQLLPDPTSPRVTTHQSFWGGPDWEAPAVIVFLPALLAMALRWGPSRLRPIVALGSPPIAACLLMGLGVAVWFADFDVLSGPGPRRSYGGYVALGAMGCFLIATSILAVAAVLRIRRGRSGILRWGRNCAALHHGL